MIVKMKKVCLVVQNKTQNEALLKLREVGVVHLEKTPLGESAPSAERKTKVESAIGLLKQIKPPKKKKSLMSGPVAHTPRATGAGVRRGRRSVDVYGTEDDDPYSLDAVRSSSRPSLPDYVVGINNERKNLQERILFLKREISRIAPFGEFEPQSVKELFELGFPVYFYELTLEVFSFVINDEKNKDVLYSLIHADKNTVRFVTFNKELQSCGTASVTPFVLPEKSKHNMKREIDEIALELEEINAKLHVLISRLPALHKEMDIVQQDIDFENATAVMETVEELPDDYSLSYLTGYLPQEDAENLKEAAAKNGWALSFTDPEEDDDKVPTKLKNSKLVNLLSPITGFLGITPGYNEVDISPWFLVFFCIFFGMIFGDAGYGIVLTLAGIAGIIKNAKKKNTVAMKLLLLLGIFNTTWGVMTCSWFGMEMDKVPQILKNISVAFFSTAKTDGEIVDKNMQFFCFILGSIHLTIAHLKGFIRNIKSLKLFAEIGSIAMLWGMFNVIMFLVVDPEYIMFPLKISIYLLGSGFGLTFIFASYEGNIFKSILESVKNIISVVLGITNVFSDIMSYIRLWAVGLAGASIAATVNSMAGPMLGGFLVFAGIILLFFGHALNVVLNLLSVIVHGVRLNTLEFSSHVGLSWSGTAYKPFAEKAINK